MKDNVSEDNKLIINLCSLISTPGHDQFHRVNWSSYVLI